MLKGNAAFGQLYLIEDLGFFFISNGCLFPLQENKRLPDVSSEESNWPADVCEVTVTQHPSSLVCSVIAVPSNRVGL